MLAMDWPEDGAIRVLMAGGDRLRRRPAQDAPFALLNGYGPTENTVISTSHDVEPAGRDAEGLKDASLPSIGRPMPNVRVYLLDENGELTPPGVLGEICLAGPQLSPGYLHRPELTAEKFIDDPFGPGKMYRTGDMARRDRDGLIHFVGRKDSQVQLRGLRIELGEIEALLNRRRDIDQSVARVLTDGAGQQRLVAYTAGNSLPSSAVLREYLREHVPAYMVPESFVALDAMPLTPNGKVDYDALPKPELAEGAAGQTPPRNSVEKHICETWRRLLKIDQTLGVEANFFELGGNSLLILEAVIDIRKTFDVDPPLHLLFEDPTIQGWATVVQRIQRGALAEAVQTPAVPLRRHGSQPPLFCVAAVGGTVLTYYALTHFLGEDQPVYGLQDPAHATKEAPIESVDELADAYARVMRETQPHGPYRLFGWSFGAIVACETARRLIDAGEEVDGLFLLDPPPVAFVEGQQGEAAGSSSLIGMFLRSFHMFLMHGIEGINLMRDGFYVQFATYWNRIHQPDAPPRTWRQKPLDWLLKAVYALFLKRTQMAQFLADGSRFILIQQPDTAGFLRIFRANVRALTRYKPEPCPVRGVVIFSDDERLVQEQEASEAFWRHMCAEGLEVERTSGNHLSTVRLPHVRTLADILRRRMGGAQAEEAQPEDESSEG
jgi:thioesterase domain-containing protein/acyl carrier protein